MKHSVGPRSILLSREMSFFLLESPADLEAERQSAKYGTYARPATEALVFHEQLVLDPSVGVYEDHLHPRLTEGASFRTLAGDGTVVIAEIGEDEYSSLLASTRDDIVEYLEGLVISGRGLPVTNTDYSYAYLLESPLGLFVKESDLYLNEVWRDVNKGLASHLQVS